jgi:transposase InsO family protein
MADHLRTELPLAALDMALHRRRPAPGLIHHSDRGCHYLADRYQARLTVAGLLPSAAAPGACFDNAQLESFFATLKTECDRTVWPTHQAARSDIYWFIEGFYQRRRRHSALGYLTPVEYDQQRLVTLAAA